MSLVLMFMYQLIVTCRRHMIMKSNDTCVSQFTLLFFKQKTAYEVRISDWSSDVCSSDLVILDDFAPDPDALRHFAAAADFAPALNHYPGVRAALPEDYLAAQLPAIAAAAAAAFGRKGPLHVVDASFSIVATPPGELTIPQRLPHEIGRAHV